MDDYEQRRRFGAAMAGAETALAAADQLCLACVDQLEVDGASVSLVYEGATRGTFGSSGELSRRIDELQFTYGEGPCLDSVSAGRPVLVDDLSDVTERRWPAFSAAVLDAGVSAVFAFPVTVASSHIGALDLFRERSGPLTAKAVQSGLTAARLAALPLLDIMSAKVDWKAAAQKEHSWDQLSSLERVEVYQATGMIVGALDVDSTEALIRLRAYAFAHGMTASEVACAIVNRQLPLDEQTWRGDDAQPGGGPR